MALHAKMDEAYLLSEFDRRVQSGTVFYDHKQEILEYTEGHLKFQFILTLALARKPKLPQTPVFEASHTLLDAPQSQAQRRDGSDINTQGYELSEVGAAHFLAINKFCFARPLLLLLTSDGRQRQYEALTEADFGAALDFLDGVASSSGNYAVFFNCGRDAGCSRLHKHMQAMPMPADSFARFLDSADGQDPGVPFHWFYHRFESRSLTAADVRKVYGDLLDRAAVVGSAQSTHADVAPGGAACPHNIIITKDWIVVIPRRNAAINSKAGANSMGMLGYIAVSSRDEIDCWLKLGLTESLRQLGVPR